MISPRVHRFWPLLLLTAALSGPHARRCDAQTVHQVQLTEKNRQAPLPNEPVVVALEVGGTLVQSQEIRTDAQGVLDLTAFQGENQKLFDEYGKRARWVLISQAGRAELASLAQNGGLARLQLDLGPVLVSGHFINAKGERVRKAEEVFAAELRPYLVSANLSWHTQCRLYSARGKGQPEEMVSNGVRFEDDGSFRFYVAKNRSYRFDWLGTRDLILATPTFAVAERDVELELVVKPRPYCLYGDFLDNAGGQPVTESINILGPDVSFFGGGQPKYAIFFDRPGKAELKIGSYVFQKKYHEQTATVDIRQPLQRQDFRLEPLEGSKTAIKFRVKVKGPALEKSYDASPYLSGENYFAQMGEYGGENIYEFTVPQAGRYNLSLYSSRLTFEAPASVQIDKEQTLEVAAVAKDTRLQVLVVDKNGQPIGFPTKGRMSMHEPRVNCVLLEEPGAAPAKGARGESYLGYGLADVGGALRPDEKGEVKFLLARGGKLVLRTSFEGFEDSSTTIDVPAHESKAVTLRLKAREQ